MAKDDPQPEQRPSPFTAVNWRHMIPMGYIAKRTEGSPGWLRPSHVFDVYSVCACVNDDFADYVDYWQHNCWWFFDSPELIQSVARENSIDLQGTKLFYYEAHQLEFADGVWRPFSPGPFWNLRTHVVPPTQKQLEGFDVVTFWVENSPAPENSPLSGDGLSNEMQTNAHCLFDTFDAAYTALNTGKFDGGDSFPEGSGGRAPGALRIFAVYSVDWPSSNCTST
jgi:hypothetical protein